MPVPFAPVTTTPVPRDIPPADSLSWAIIGETTDRDMSDRDMRRVRTIVQLRRDLPLDPESRRGVPPVTTRSLDPDTDLADLLALNNAAFSWHPEQGGWDRDRLRAALAEPWVDLAGILVHQGDDDRLDGFCWTRVHPRGDPAADDAGANDSGVGDPTLGEIWVIAAHPERHGTRLGPALVAAGLDHLSDRGLRTAVLYTEEDNLPARRMYERMGFSVHERRGGYR